MVKCDFHNTGWAKYWTGCSYILDALCTVIYHFSTSMMSSSPVSSRSIENQSPQYYPNSPGMYHWRSSPMMPMSVYSQDSPWATPPSFRPHAETVNAETQTTQWFSSTYYTLDNYFEAKHPANTLLNVSAKFIFISDYKFILNEKR